MVVQGWWGWDVQRVRVEWVEKIDNILGMSLIQFIFYILLEKSLFFKKIYLSRKNYDSNIKRLKKYFLP